MRVLVTGSNGFLGSALVDRLLTRGVDRVVCLVRSGSNRKRLDAVLAKHGGKAAEVRVGSLASVEAAERAIEGVDQLQHLAAALSGSAADMCLNSVVTSKNLLEAVCRSASPPEIVLTSSFALYGVSNHPRGYLVTESSEVEPHPELRDLYSFSKIRQEKLFWEYRERHGIKLTVVRPGVIYGPGGTPISNRVGLRLPGAYFHLGGKNILPLTYVDNCAEALAAIAEYPAREGEVVNVVDDDLPTSDEYLAQYKKQVEPMRTVRLPYGLTLLLAHGLKYYHERSQGQLPAILTPYKVKATWKGNRFDNAKLKRFGWHQLVPTDEGLSRTFDWLRAQRS